MEAAPNHQKPPSWVIDRRNADSLKWSHCQNTDVLPMWVADMDFRCAEPIIAALRARVEQGDFGYAAIPEETTQTVVDWIESQHQWHIESDWIVWVPGLVPSLHIICRAFAEEDDQILTFTPIYPPFLSAPPLSGRKLVTCPLHNDKGYYSIDFEALRTILTDKIRLLLLCSPHNPVGRLWTKNELGMLAEICLERNILLCSDEIHCDLVLDPAARHTPIAALSKELEDRSLTLMSAAKTFNLPGLNCGFAIIPNQKLRQQFKQTARGIIPHVNIFGYAACRAAFQHGLPWLHEVLDYLRQNHQLLHTAVNQIPGLFMGRVQATYLAWIDVRQLHLRRPALFFHQAGVVLMDGAAFGQPGFVRLNFACSQKNLVTAIDSINKAVADLKETY